MSVDMQTFLDSAVQMTLLGSVCPLRRTEESRAPSAIVLVGSSSSGPVALNTQTFDPIRGRYVGKNAFDTVTEILEGVGWGTEPGEECARLHLLGENGHQLRTWSRTQWPDTAEHGGHHGYACW